MTPEEKAKELVDKFKDFAHGYRAKGYNKQLFENAKQCALIAVDEIITEMEKESMEHRVQYFQKVKEAINNQ